MNKTVDYATAVYAEEADAMALSIALRLGLSETEDPARLPVLAAALVTAMQMTDGNHMPRQSKLLLHGGLAHRVKQLLGDARFVNDLGEER
jgi:hypothetical protein